MRQYWAIAKRDWGQNKWTYGFYTVFFLLIPILTSLLGSSEETPSNVFSIYLPLFFIAFVGSQNLKALYAHAQGFLYPNVRELSFNYIKGLLIVISLATGIVVTSNAVEFYLAFAVLLLASSGAFWFAFNEFSMRLWVAGTAVCVLLVAELLMTPGGYMTMSIQWLIEQTAAIQATVATLAFGTYLLNVHLFKQRYFQARELDEDLLPKTWFKPISQLSDRDLFSNLKTERRTRNRYDKVLEVISRWQAKVRLINEQNPIEKGLFGSAVTLSSLLGLLLTLFVIMLGLTSLRALMADGAGIHPEAWRMTVSFFLVLLLVLSNALVSLEFISSRSMMARLWLWGKFANRRSSMKLFARVLAKRYLRFLTLFISVFVLFAFVTNPSLSGHFFFAYVALGALATLPLQMAMALSVTRLGIYNAAWRYGVIFCSFAIAGLVMLFAILGWAPFIGFVGVCGGLLWLALRGWQQHALEWTD